jgi:hypothetical protein
MLESPVFRIFNLSKTDKKSTYEKVSTSLRYEFISPLALVFDLDNVLVKSSYKKHKLGDYDSYVYVNIL